MSMVKADAMNARRNERNRKMNKKNVKTVNPKKQRKITRKLLDRHLDVEKVLLLYFAALDAGAPLTATRIINMRGGITVAEAEALVRFINIEAAENNSLVRVVLEMKSEA